MKTEKTCPVCDAGIKVIDYKDVQNLKKYITKFNKIVPKYYSWVCLKHQKSISQSIKRARYMALIPYVLDLK